jgi:hypothetical protein
VRKARKRIATGDVATNRLYEAVAAYVEKNGGSVVVIGGIQIQEWPGDGKFKFTVAVRCSGRRPVYATPEAGERARKEQQREG